MGQSLFDVVKNADKKNKSAIGYNVTTYKNVLDGLQEQLWEGTGSNDNKNQVFGITRTDYSGVQGMTFDHRGFSKNDDAIWKMVISVTGSCPVKYDNSYDIARFEHETPANRNRNPFGNVDTMCPQFLTDDTLKTIQSDDFVVGAAIDLNELGVKYFTQYFSHAGTEITSDMVTKLFTQNCIRAQIIFPNKNKSLLVDIIQRTPFSNMACIYISTPLASADEWKDCEIGVNIKADNKTYSFIPTGDKYVSAVDGQPYTVGKQKMGGMNKKSYQTWLNQSADKYVTGAQTLWLQKAGQPKTCYVKLFIPLQKKAQAMDILDSEINENIFKQYAGVTIRETTSSNNEAQGEYSVVCDGIGRDWSGVRTNDGSGTINYSLFKPELDCRTFVKGTGGMVYTTGGRQIAPKFGPSRYYLDCSSLACFLTINALANSNLLKDDVVSLNAYDSATMPTFPSYINKYLKPGYKAICIPITDINMIKTGDILFCNNKEKGQYKGTNQTYGHAAWAYVEQGKLKTLEIGSENKTKLLCDKPRTTTPKNGKYYYRNLVRIVKE